MIEPRCVCTLVFYLDVCLRKLLTEVLIPTTGYDDLIRRSVPLAVELILKNIYGIKTIKIYQC